MTGVLVCLSVLPRLFRGQSADEFQRRMAAKEERTYALEAETRRALNTVSSATRMPC